MGVLTAATILFLVLEMANVVTLYFFPGSRYANGVGVFCTWEKSKQDPEIHEFVKYLVNWVAGTKLIFIMLLIVILYVGGDQLLQLTALVMAISILSFFWRLFPLVRRMDRAGQISPQGYSVALGGMIAGFIVVFLAALLFSVG